MCLHLLLPKVNPNQITPPTKCEHPTCQFNLSTVRIAC
jgi:hypothetical protein